MCKELFLRTVFSCMACDGNIAPEEIKHVKQLVEKSNIFDGIDVKYLLNSYIEQINQNGKVFLNQYLKDLANAQMSKEEEFTIISLALQTIDSDNVIEYSEVKFFKKIRSRLSLSNEEILEKYPDKEDFLLPDVNEQDILDWNDITFTNIEFDNYN